MMVPFFMARPKRFELPFSGIGIRCVIQLRHGRLSDNLLYTQSHFLSRPLTQKEYDKIRDVVHAEEKIEAENRFDDPLCAMKLGFIERGEQPRENEDQEERKETFYGKARRDIPDDPAHEGVRLKEAAAPQEHHGADPIGDIERVDQPQPARGTRGKAHIIHSITLL